MSDVELSEKLLSNLAGWQAVKHARGLLAAGRVLRSEWTPPALRGAVQEGQAVLQCGLVIRSASDADNLCPCRDSRQRGLICAHSVATGLHFLLGPPASAAAAATAAATATLPPSLATFKSVARPKLHLAGGLAMLQAKLEGDPRTAARLLHGGFTGPDTAGLYHLNGQNAVLNFFARDYPRLETDWEVTLEERLQRSSEKLERVEPRFQITPSGEQWFDLNVTYDTSGGQRLPQAEIQRLLRSGQGYAPLPNGKFALLDTGAVEELEQVLVDCNPRQHPGGYRLENTQAGFLDATLRERCGWDPQAPPSWKERAALQRGQIKLQPPPLGDLETILRPYQKEGVGWLSFLRANGFGGILADEMGLGKTVQVLAHLRSIPRRAGPSLVVCPTSLVFNWEA